MNKNANTSVDLHPILAERWSPRAYDNSATLSIADLTGILEAARWAPSSSNSQPWRFVVARRGDYRFSQLIEAMAGFNKIWSPNASALILVSAVTTQADGSERYSAMYDAGLAASLMTVEAHHRGQVVHQIGGFDHGQVRAEFNIPSEVTPIAILAIGKQAPAEALTDPNLFEREVAERTRVSLDSLILAGDLSLI